MKGIRKKTLVVICIIALIATLGVVLAASYSMTSPSSPNTTLNPTPSPSPTPQATLSAVTVSKTTLTVGDTQTLTTTVSDGLAGLSVEFKTQTGLSVGTAITDSSGVATLTFQPTIGTWSYRAYATHP